MNDRLRHRPRGEPPPAGGRRRTGSAPRYFLNCPAAGPPTASMPIAVSMRSADTGSSSDSLSSHDSTEGWRLLSPFTPRIRAWSPGRHKEILIPPAQRVKTPVRRGVRNSPLLDRAHAQGGADLLGHDLARLELQGVVAHALVGVQAVEFG